MINSRFFTFVLKILPKFSFKFKKISRPTKLTYMNYLKYIHRIPNFKMTPLCSLVQGIFISLFSVVTGHTWQAVYPSATSLGSFTFFKFILKQGLTVWPRPYLDLGSSCFSFWVAGITSMQHHAWLSFSFIDNSVLLLNLSLICI